MFNVLICDDDIYTVRVLKKVIEENEEINEIFLAFNGEEAVEIVKNNNINLAFMDVDMPLMDGLEASKIMLSIDEDLKIVFITAYRDYACDSYEVKALDYILKPIDFSRVKSNMERIIALTTEAKQENTLISNDLLIIKEKQGYNLINMSEINYIEKEHNQLVVNVMDKKYYTNVTLSEMEKKLTSNFLRTHKSYIVNLKNIQRIEPYGDTSFIIYFKNTDELSNALITKEKMKLLQL